MSEMPPRSDISEPYERWQARQCCGCKVCEKFGLCSRGQRILCALKENASTATKRTLSAIKRVVEELGR
jgi:hypothetical protein